MIVPARWSVVQSGIGYPVDLVGVAAGGEPVTTDVQDVLLGGDGVQAATVFAWGSPIPALSDEFTGTSVDTTKWNVYSGAGNGGQGTRSPSQVTVANGSLFINGDANGNTGGLQVAAYSQYGRWETRMRIPAGDTQYHALALLFPEESFNPPATNWPQGGEIDYAETTCASAGQNFFLHYSSSNSQVSGYIPLDLTQWHNYAVEWTATSMRGWADGVLFFECYDTAKLPPGPQHQCLQLDWVPASPYVSTTPSSMEVAWVRAYSL